MADHDNRPVALQHLHLAIAITVIAGSIVMGVLHAPLLRAQSTPPQAASSAFEVASVKPNTSNAPANSRFPMGPGDAYVPGRLFSAANQPLIVYLRFAFKLGQGTLLRLPR